MTDNSAVRHFIEACERWVCEDYSLDIRYLATVVPAGYEIFDAAIALNPLPVPRDHSLRLSATRLLAGQLQRSAVRKEELLSIVKDALNGSLTAHEMTMVLPHDGDYRVQSAVIDQSTWFSPLSLQVFGRSAAALSEPTLVDNELRASIPPFDGLADLCSWLALRGPDPGSLCSISVAVNPPVDLMIDRSGLAAETLRLILHAHPKADLSQVRVAVRAVPDEGLLGRQQIADRIAWAEVVDGRREGAVEVNLASANAALTMLLIGADTVRRHWFLDPMKAGTTRMAAVQQFDTDLRMIRQGLFDTTESVRFEMAVASLLFLLGFAPALQLETDSPDIIVSTPQGRIVLVECTTRVADAMTKLGKLVDRRGALTKALQADNQRADVAAALVCRLPRDQIAAHSDTIRSMGVLLVAAEELTEGLQRARFPSNPDDILTQALQTLVT